VNTRSKREPQSLVTWKRKKRENVSYMSNGNKTVPKLTKRAKGGRLKGIRGVSTTLSVLESIREIKRVDWGGFREDTRENLVNKGGLEGEKVEKKLITTKNKGSKKKEVRGQSKTKHKVKLAWKEKGNQLSRKIETTYRGEKGMES